MTDTNETSAVEAALNHLLYVADCALPIKQEKDAQGFVERARAELAALRREWDARQVEDYRMVDAANRARHIELYEMEMRARKAEAERDAARAALPHPAASGEETPHA